MNRSLVLFLLSILLICQVFSLYAQRNLIKNPSFEEEHNLWASHWFTRSYLEGENEVKYYLNNSKARTGEKCLFVSTHVSNDIRVYQYVDVEPLTVYKLSVWIRFHKPLQQ